MKDIPPGVPRRAGGHAADRLREQLEREFGIVAPDEPLDPAAGADPEEAGLDGATQPDPGEQQGH
jgi:hypothetical protein